MTGGSVLPLSVWVAGRARTKGSLRPQGHRLVEQVAGSKGWREIVAQTVLRHCGATPGPGGFVRWWEAERGPVVVGLTVFLPRPAGRGREHADWPVQQRDGDLDKYQRNVGDALTDTQVIADDAQIVGWAPAWKVWAPDASRVGIWLTVGRADMSGHMPVVAGGSSLVNR